MQGIPGEEGIYIIDNFSFTRFGSGLILRHSAEKPADGVRGFFDIFPIAIDINYALFNRLAGVNAPEMVELKYNPLTATLSLSCGCTESKKNLCSHQAQVLWNMLQRNELLLFFDEQLRHEKLQLAAKDYGLEAEEHLDDYFQLIYTNKAVDVRPKMKELLAVNDHTNKLLTDQLLSPAKLPQASGDETQTLLVFAKHRYFESFTATLYQASFTRAGKPKNPLQPQNASTLIWAATDEETVKFYAAISQIQQVKDVPDIATIRALVKNPQRLGIYYHEDQSHDQVSASSLLPIQVKTTPVEIRLQVTRTAHFYQVSAMVSIEDSLHDLQDLDIKFTYFIKKETDFYCIADDHVLKTIDFFRKNNFRILVHLTRYNAFQKDVLSKLEDRFDIKYEDSRVRKDMFPVNEKIIYLYDLDHYVEIAPVIRYGEIEIPVLTKRQIHTSDEKGKPVVVPRDSAVEKQFISLLMRQHPDFYEQEPHSNYFFYLHKKRFLDEDWFLNAFEEWRSNGITIYGFNEIAHNKINSYRPKITVHVTSGINWFNTHLNVVFGKQKASLKHLHKTIRNKSRYVQLDDGTLGVLPKEWIAKIERYMEWGEVIDELIRTPKINFASISNIYEDEVLASEVKEELALYEHKLSHIETISHAPVPEHLQTTLRDYQQQGLDWLNLMDELGFGACLADDMGLGKTVQVISLLLLQKAKKRNASLVVVPTSLLFNWQAELTRFAPSLKQHLVYGTDRIKHTASLADYDVILTSYGTLQRDILHLRHYCFNYIILDESQAIKNPLSTRYKTVRLLQSRNKIVMTGTPVENNTFDLYSQLSFACPGLLGSKQHFRDIYSIPIDKFKDSSRAMELQYKISPFILRRTKEQVAKELPEKTEMVLYCEMEETQRKIYAKYEKEFREYISNAEEEDIKKNSMYVLKGITRLRQICDSPALLKEEQQVEDASIKITTLLEEISNKSSRHKILVFSQFVSMLDLLVPELKKQGISFEYLSGKTTNRAAKVNAFQNDENIRVFLISMKAGGTGLNLTKADYVYLLDPWWNPAVENQAIDRSYRLGQEKHVVAVRLICPNTVEEKIMKLQESKKELVKDLISAEASFFDSFSRADWMQLLE